MKVVIVGGGTAGWLTACYFESYNKIYEEDNQFHLRYDMTVIESPSVPIIGAGEGSTGMFPDMVKKLSNIGITELDFFYETESTQKLAINFKDWNGIGTSYLSPLSPTFSYNKNVDIELFAFAAEADAPDACHVGYFAKRGYSTYRKNLAQRIDLHSYHFDAHKVGQYFRKKAVDVGTKHIVQHIVGINKDDKGNIKSVQLESGEVVYGDLFIDCSGFSRVLAKQMDMGWISYAEHLPVNSALPYIHQFKENEQIMPETLAWAQKNGWMWQIPTQERYGCGYVYCDAFVDADTALQELQETTGRNIKPIRNLKFEVGRLETLWKNNVVAIGLSSAFLEPLQATSIHTTILQVQMLLNYLHPNETNNFYLHSKTYSDYLARVIDEFKDLIQIHYMTTREDTPFWKFIKHDLKKTERTKFVLETAQYRTLGFHDFDVIHGTASWGVWAWTLVGLGIINKRILMRTINKHGLQEYSKLFVEQFTKQNEQQIKSLLTHTEFVNAIRERKFNPNNFIAKGDISRIT